MAKLFVIFTLVYFLQYGDLFSTAPKDFQGSEDSFDFSPCGDATWKEYEDLKCFKLIDEFLTRDEARSRCLGEMEEGRQEDDPIVTIKTEKEQIFIVDLLYTQWKLVDNVWLGAARRRANSTTLPEFQWDDGQAVEFSNWGEGQPSDVTERNCSQLISRLSAFQLNSDSSARSKNLGPQIQIDGEWTDVSCVKRNLVVCQKTQNWRNVDLLKAFFKLRQESEETTSELSITQLSLTVMSEKLSSLQAAYDDIKNGHQDLQEQVGILETSQNKLENNPVPIGFVYIQLPNQFEPDRIWPTVTWSEISSQFAGLFFRVLGGNSDAFGQIQSANATILTNVEFSSVTDSRKFISLNSGWSDWLTTSYFPEHFDEKTDRIRFFTSAGENRPINTAVRIWQRTA